VTFGAEGAYVVQSVGGLVVDLLGGALPPCVLPALAVWS
jgi:hypothetical protein